MAPDIFFSHGSEQSDFFDRLRNLSFERLDARVEHAVMEFKRPAGTSRGVLTQKSVWFLTVSDGHFMGVGECAPLPGLSPDFTSAEGMLREVADSISHFPDWLLNLDDYPSVKFALETALLDLEGYGNKILFPSRFTEGKEAILINGLIWMGDPESMVREINDKLEQGFRVLKMKIGSLDFSQEMAILEQIRSVYGPDELELRLDANGAFKPREALRKLEQLFYYHIHSVEQPIKAGSWDDMADVCRESPIPVALDEELIGVCGADRMQEMLETVLPSYLIIKPTLCGGFQGAEDWIAYADQLGIGWWATSALESNIGLNAIAQWVYAKQNPVPQGLGTGKLFRKNIESPLFLEADTLRYDAGGKWDLSLLFDA
jgi:o-succinylbenzoate synthase